MEENEIDLKEILLDFWNKKLQIILIISISILIGIMYTIAFVKPVYTSSTTLLLATSGSASNQANTITTTDLTLNSKLVSTYSALAQSKSVLSKVISNKGGDVSKIFVVATKKDMLTNAEGEKKEKEFLIRLGELYNNDSMAVSRFAFVAAEVHLMTTQVIQGINLEPEEKKKFKKALLEIDEDLEFSDVRRKADDILKYASVNDLFDRINKVVLLNRRNYIVNGIINDYIKCMKVINENASLYLDDSKAYLKKLTEDREYDQSQIEKIEQSNRDIEILQGKIRKIRRNLEIEISANSENIIVR